MKRLFVWTWMDGIVSTFLSGLFALLPIAITVAIIGWVVGHLQAMLGPSSRLGTALESVGLQFVTENNKGTAQVIGWVFVLSGIWLLGLLTKSMAKNRITGAFKGAINHIPIVKGIYSTSSQLVGMFRKDDASDLNGMSAVFCTFGDKPGAGFLGLMASSEVYHFGDVDYHVVYVPMAPLPMSGSIVFVPVEQITRIDMSAEQVMRIYLSLGILTPQVVPGEHRTLPDLDSFQPENQSVLP